MPDGPQPFAVVATGDIIAPAADLRLTKTDGSCYVLPGETVSYTITVSNNGPDDAIGATVVDAFPPELTGITWTCTPTGAASCTASGGGDISDSVDLPVGDSAVYSATATVSGGASGFLVNTASVTSPVSVPDPDPSNNSDADINALEIPLFCDDFETGDTAMWSGG